MHAPRTPRPRTRHGLDGPRPACDAVLVLPADEQLAALDALLAQTRPLWGRDADELVRRMRRLWQDEEDREDLLRGLAMCIREQRGERVGCEDADEDPSPI